MTYTVYDNLDLVTNQLNNAVIQNLGTAPTGIPGRVYYDTTLHEFGYYNGTIWIYSVTTPAATAIALGTVQLAGDLAGTGSVATAPTVGNLHLTADTAINHKLTSVTDPTLAQDAATKNYVDSAGVGGAMAHAVQAASTANISLSPAITTLDSTTLVSGVSRILLGFQTTQSQNGIWVYNGSGVALTRPTDWASGTIRKTGEAIFVDSGSTFAGYAFYADTGFGPTFMVDTTAVLFNQIKALPVGTAGGDLTGTYPNPTIAAGAVTVAKLASTTSLSAIAAANASTGAITASTQQITNVVDPTTAQMAATKNYVDTVSAAQGTQAHAVHAMASVNVPITSPGITTLDGVTLVSGVSRIFLSQQTVASQSGIWVYNGSGAALTRPADWASGSVHESGELVVMNPGGTSFGLQVRAVSAVSLAPTFTVDTTTVNGSIAEASPIGVASGDLFGSYPGPAIAAGAVTVAKTATSLTLDAIATAHATAADVVMNSHKITGLLDPTNPQDAATKNYVDVSVEGLAPKAAVAVATAAALPTYTQAGSGATGHLTGITTGTLTVDGVLTTLGMRILVLPPGTIGPGNTTIGGAAVAKDAGIYVVTTAGAVGTAYILTRSPDATTWAELQGALVPVATGGTVNADSVYLFTGAATGTLDTTAQTWSVYQSALGIVGDGVYTLRTGNVLGGILSGDPATATAGAAGTVGTAGVSRIVKAQIKTDGSTTTQNITHNLNDFQVGVSIQNQSGSNASQIVGVTWAATSANVIQVQWPSGNVPTTGTVFYVTIHS